MIPFHSAEPVVQLPSHLNQDDDVSKIFAIDEQHYPALVGTYDAYDDDLTTVIDPFPSIDKYSYYHDDSDGGPQRYSKFLKCDCKWTGCDPECKKTHKDEDMSLDSWTSDNELLNPNSVWPVRENYEIQPYTPDSDHCYYASKQVISEKVDISLDILKNIPTPPASSAPPSETTSDDEDEVDVVTVPDEYLAPVIAYNFEVPRRNTRSQRSVKKSQRTQQLSAKSLKAAMKRTRAKNLSMCRTYKRRKVGNGDHHELIPSSSNVSSSQSSRCSSDVEDVGKRNNHNCIERERRASLRTALQNLRVLIPELQNNNKAPKVLILNSATNLINRLKIKDRTLDESKQIESKRQSLTCILMLCIRTLDRCQNYVN